LVYAAEGDEKVLNVLTKHVIVVTNLSARNP